MKPPPPPSLTNDTTRTQEEIMRVQFSNYKRTRRRLRRLGRKSTQQPLDSDQPVAMSPLPCHVHSYLRTKSPRHGGRSLALEVLLLLATLLCLNLAHTLPPYHQVACSPIELSPEATIPSANLASPLDAYKLQAPFNQSKRLPQTSFVSGNIDRASLIGLQQSLRAQVNSTNANRMQGQLLPGEAERVSSLRGRARRHDQGATASAIEFKSRGQTGSDGESSGDELVPTTSSANVLGYNGKSQEFGDYEVPSDDQEEMGDEADRKVPTSVLSNRPANDNNKYNPIDQSSARDGFNESTLSSANPSTTDWLLANSFLSHIDKQWKFAEIILIIVISAILNLVTIVGNIMVLISFKMDRSLQTVSNYFLLSLALADLLIGLISMPLYTLYLLLNYWPLGPLMCDIWLAIDYLNSNAAVLNMLIISFDRYFSVTRPLTYRAKRTTKHAILMISFAWILSLTIWTPAIFTYPYYKGRTVQGTDKCEIEFVKANTYLTFVTAILAFYIPVAIMIYLYWRIWLETKKRYRDLTTLFLVSGVGAAAPRPPNRPIISAITAGSSSNSNNNNNTNNSSNSLAPVPACQDGRRLANIAASASAKSHLFGRTVGSKKTHGNNSSNLSAAPSRKSQLKAKSSLKLAPTAGAASEKGELSSSPKQVGGDRTNVDMKRGGGGASTSDRIASEEDDFLIGVESKTSGTALKGAAAPLGAPTSKEVHSQHPSSTQELGTSDDKQHAVSLLLYNQSRDQSSSAAPGENAGAAPAAKSKHSAPASTSLTKHCKCAAATTSKCCYINSSCAAPATLATLSRQIACKVTPTRCPLIVDNCKACQEYIRQHSRAAAAHSGDKKVRNFCDGEQLTTSSSKTNAAPSACCSSCCCPCTANSSQLACRHSPPSAPCDSAVPFSSNNESFNEASSQAQKQADDNKQNKRTQRSSSKMASCSCSTGVTTMPSCCQKASANNANSRSKLALGLVGQSGQPTRDQSKAPSTSAVGNSSSKSIYQLISDASGPPQRVKIHPKLSGDSSPPTAPADASLHQLDVDAEAPIEEDSRLVPERAQQEGQPPPLGDREEQRESKSDDVSEQQAAAAAAEQKRLVDVATSPINFSSPLGERADSKIISDFQLEPDEDSFEQEDFETRIVSYGDRLRFESNDPKLIRAASSGSSRGPISSHHHTSSAPTQRPAAAAALQRIDTDGGSRAAATTSDRCCCVEVISAHDAECKFCRPITKPDQHFGQHQRQPIASGADTSPTAAPSGRLVDGHLHQQQHQQCSEHHHGIGRGGHAHHHHRTIAYHGHQHHGHHHHGHHSHNHRSHGHYYHHHQHHHHHHHGGHYKRDPSCQLAAASKHKLKSECKACLVRVPKMTMHGGGSKMIEMSTPAETITKNVAAASNLGQDADEGQTAALDRAAETSGSLPILGVLQQMSPDRQAKLRAASGAREDATGSKSSGNGAKYKKLSQKLTFSDILIEERAPSMVGRGSNKFSPRSHKHQQASSSCTNRDAGARQVKIMPKWTGALSKSQRAEKLRNLYDDRDDEGSDRGALAEGSEGDGHRRWFKSAYSNLVNWHFVSSLPQIGVLMPCKRANRNRYRANESTHQDGNGGYRDGNEHDDADGDDDNEDQEAESDNDDRDANSDGGNEERPGCADAELGAPTRERRHGAKILDTICCSAKPLIKRFSSNDSSSYNDTTTVGTHQKGAKLSLPTATGSSNVQQSRLISSDTRHQQGQQRHGSSHYNNSSSKSSSSASQSNQHQHNHHHPIQPKSERKAAKTLSTLLLVFIVTWLPYNVLVLIKTLSGGEDQVPEKIWNFSYYLCYINSTINPLCYALCNAQFRRTYMRILKCKLSNEHNSTRRLVPIQSSSTWNKDLRLNSTSNLECGNSTSQTNSSGAANNQQSQQEVGSGRKRKQPRKSK